MAKTTQRQNSFASGELDPKVLGRDDLDRYNNGLKTMVNWLPKVQGGMGRFPGTEYLAQLSGPTRLEAFEFTDGNKYVVAGRDGSVDIYKNDVLFQSLTPVALIEANLFTIDYTQALDTVIFTHPDVHTFRMFLKPDGSIALEDLFDGSAPGHSGVLITNIPQVDGADIWSDALGYPAVCTFVENRLCLAGSKSYPNDYALSKSGDFFDFDTGTGLADEAIYGALLSDALEAIKWVTSTRRLTFGTISSVWAVDQTEFVTPEKFNIKRQNGIGSKRVKPVTVDGEILHATRNGNQLRGTLWNDIEQAMTTNGLSVLNTRAVVGCKQLAVKDAVGEDAANLVLSVNSNGVLGVLNTLREQEFVAWCRRTSAGDVESAAVVGEDIYLVIAYPQGEGVFQPDVFEADVFEETGGSSVRFLVKVNDDAKMDYQLTTTKVVETDTFDGFDHLEGSTVQVILDGAVHPDVVVTAGGIVTTQIEGLVCTAGVAIPMPTAETMPPAISPYGSSKVLTPKRILRCLTELLDTVSLNVAGEQLQIRESTQDINAPVVPFTGVKDVRILGRADRPTVTITAEEPAAATVLSLDMEVAF